MIEFKSFPATVKAVDGNDPNGEFEVVLSTKAVDRDGEAVLPGAFDPLPASIPIYYHHDWQAGAMPVGKARPFQDGDVLKATGVFAPTPRAQELRELVNGGFVDSMSVGFTRTKREVIQGQKSVVKADLFEASFTPIPINTDALVLTSKAGARNSASDGDRLQQIHDLAVENGAYCPTTKAADQHTHVKAIVGSVEAQQERVRDALEDAYGDWMTYLRGVLPNVVVFDWYGAEGDTYQQTYEDDGAVVTLTGQPVEVDIHEVIAPDADADREANDGPTMLALTAKAAGEAAAQAAADPAADEAAQAKARIRAAALI
jgi:HK97 family phage prohead protease